MPTHRFGMNILAFVLAFGLASGVLIHAAFPHEHGEVGKGVSPIWQTLHMALRHEDKKTFFVLADASAFPLAETNAGITTGLVLIALILYVRQRPFDAMLDPLRRGIVPYRKFG